MYTSASLGNAKLATANISQKWIFFLLLALPFFSFAADLEKNEAIIIVGMMEEDGLIDTLRFKEYTSGEGYNVESYLKSKPQTFKAGNYYLSKIILTDDNYAPILYGRPDDIKSTFKIFPGTVTYLGAWHIKLKDRTDYGTQWDISRDYPEEFSSVVAEKYKYLTNYPLIISNNNGELFKHKW